MIPKNLDEAVEDLIVFLELEDKNNKELKNLTLEQFSASTHHTIGQFIRNNYYLWWYKDHKFKDWPEEKPEIVDWFNSHNIYHADDISGIILQSVYHKIVGIEYNIELLAKPYIDFWKEQGYNSGNPFN